VKTFPTPASAISAVTSARLRIEHQCPQCGAPAELQETDRLFTCAYCRVKSFLIPKDVFRYVLPDKAPQGTDLLFFPYWRFKGMLFSCMEDGVRHRFLDIDHPAAEAPLFPRSVGLRSQALKLRFATADVSGRFILPSLTMDQVVERLAARFTHGLQGSVFHQARVGEALSLIYSPFYIRQRLYDAVLNRPISDRRDPVFDPDTLATGPAQEHIRFLAAICPHCGADMEGARESLVLACTNCDSLWTGSAGRFKRLAFGHLPFDVPPARCLPFWRVEADVSGICLQSYADLIRAANLPRVVRASMETETFRFWTLAFKLRPKAFLSLATRITLVQPRQRQASGLPDAPLHPVTLPYAEALETLKVTLADFVKPRRVLLPRLSEVTVSPKRLRLVYVPFEETQHDLVHPGLGLSVNKAMLATAGNL
jgi:DNA-directed RNA polymerase subunit RPC12/RpoP